MPATPRWLLAIPDAIRQLDALDREVLTRRDVEQLFGVSRARAATAHADLRGRDDRRTRASRVLRRTEAPPPAADGTGQRAAFRGEEERRTRPGRHRASARPDSPGSGSRCPARRSRRACPACPRAYRSNPAGYRGALQRRAGRRRAALRARPGADATTTSSSRRSSTGRRRARRGRGEGMSEDLVPTVEPAGHRAHGARAAGRARAAAA